jgi:hypothetical protein
MVGKEIGTKERTKGEKSRRNRVNHHSELNSLTQYKAWCEGRGQNSKELCCACSWSSGNCLHHVKKVIVVFISSGYLS